MRLALLLGWLCPGTNAHPVAEASHARVTGNAQDVLVVGTEIGVQGDAFPRAVIAGQKVTLRLTVYNTGSETARGLLLTNFLPADLQYVTASSSQGTGTNCGPYVLFELGALANLGRADINLTALTTFPLTETNCSITITSLVSVACEGGDLYPENNQAVILITLLADADQDQMPDVWELAQSFDRLNPDDANEDTDGDGHSNLQEYRAETDPWDANSILRILDVTISGGDLRVSFPFVLGRSCELQTTADLGAHPVTWTPVPGGQIAIDGDIQTLTHRSALTRPAGYYRVVPH